MGTQWSRKSEHGALRDVTNTPTSGKIPLHSRTKPIRRATHCHRLRRTGSTTPVAQRPRAAVPSRAHPRRFDGARQVDLPPGRLGVLPGEDRPPTGDATHACRAAAASVRVSRCGARNPDGPAAARSTPWRKRVLSARALDQVEHQHDDQQDSDDRPDRVVPHCGSPSLGLDASDASGLPALGGPKTQFERGPLILVPSSARRRA